MKLIWDGIIGVDSGRQMYFTWGGFNGPPAGGFGIFFLRKSYDEVIE